MNLPTLALPKVSEGLDVRGLSLIAPVGGLIASLVIIFMIVWPKYNQIKELKVSNDDLVQRAGKLEEKAAILTSLDATSLEKQLAAAEAILPSEKDVFTFIRQIESAARASGVLLNRVEAVTGSINDSVGSVPVAPPPTGAFDISGSGLAGLAPKIQARLSLTGSYRSLLQFLSSMYGAARTVTINDIAIASAGEGQVRISLTIDAYWKQLPTDLGSIEKVVVKLTNSESALLDSVVSQDLTSGPSVPEVPLGRSDLFAPL